MSIKQRLRIANYFNSKESVMTKMCLLAVSFLVVGGFSLVQAGNIDKGKVLFESPQLGGGTTGKSCKSCHKEGRNLSSDLFDREQYTIMGNDKKSLAEVINFCIERPLGGKAIAPQGDEMLDLKSYISTLVSK